MKEIIALCIVVAFSLTTHPATAQTPNYGYGGKTHIVGRDGLCLDIFQVSITMYGPTKLSPCESSKQSQLWTSLEDGTIRFFDNRYCLAPFNNAIGASVGISECNKGRPINKVWNQKKDGTMVHVQSGLVLTAKSGRFSTLESNENTPSQSWQCTESFYPLDYSIKWLNNLCLESSEGENSYLSLRDCSRENKNQRWALYGDGTIRLNTNKNHCLTSSDKDSGSLVDVSQCLDKPQQRWDMNPEDSTINHPNTNLVIDVLFPIANLPLAIIIDKHSEGRSSQRWTLF